MQLFARPQPPRAYRVAPPGPEPCDGVAAPLGLVRRIANFLGQPERCGRKSCRRAKLCRGDPPDCWRGEPPPAADELAYAKSRFHALLAARARELDWDGDAQG